LPEPVICARFWKNRRHDEVIVVSLSTYEGHNIIDLRAHATKDGRLMPTRKGLAMTVRCLPKLAKAVTKALAEARQRGLVDDDGAPS
jgi:hypothetical protein